MCIIWISFEFFGKIIALTSIECYESSNHHFVEYTIETALHTYLPLVPL